MPNRVKGSILSLQSHVAYGYVGNKAAVYPLQAMGYDVWPVNTVQFSNHTGYGKWRGEIFTAEHVSSVVQGILDLGQADQCRAILSGYMGSREICQAVSRIVEQFKAVNQELVYLCDPVIGDHHCFVKPEVLEFFKENLIANIITPNQYEAEVLSGIAITEVSSVKKAAQYFHTKGIDIVIITGLRLSDLQHAICTFVSDQHKQYLLPNEEYSFSNPMHGTGDLFSSLYLGYYLANHDIGLSLQQTLHNLQQVLQNTYQDGSEELRVLSVKYDDVTDLDLVSPLVAI